MEIYGSLIETFVQ